MSETATMSTVSFLFRSLAGGLLVCICCAASKVATVVLAPSFFAVIMVAVASIICWWIARLFVSAASIVVANVATLPICGKYDNNFHFSVVVAAPNVSMTMATVSFFLSIA